MRRKFSTLLAIICVGAPYAYDPVHSQEMGAIQSYGPDGRLYSVDQDGLPPEKWSSLKYGLWPDGGLRNAEEETQGGRDCREAAAG
jgi:hypothetical protein